MMTPTALQILKYIHFLFVHSYLCSAYYLLQILLNSAVCLYILIHLLILEIGQKM